VDPVSPFCAVQSKVCRSVEPGSEGMGWLPTRIEAYGGCNGSRVERIA
jgi:hypothetical protein